MAFLKIYKWERETYPEFQKIEIGRSDAPKYFKKFARHFKVIEPILLKRTKQSGGAYFRDYIGIALPKTTYFGVIIHEFAHHLADQKTRSRNGHNKRFKRALKQVYSFAKRYI